MEQLRDFADSRLFDGCIYCGGVVDSREHVPPKVFLDQPFPENLPAVPACRTCNNDFSADEEYLATLLEVVAVGSSDPTRIKRPRIARALQRSPAFRARFDAAKRIDGNRIEFDVELDRLRRVLAKLAQGHAWFELSRTARMEPSVLECQPLESLSDEDRDQFLEPHYPQLWDEIGSRGFQRMAIVAIRSTGTDGEEVLQKILLNDWIDVQPGRYSYLAYSDPGRFGVKIILGGYLACEVVWNDI